jgi:hypothetical protein
VLSLSLERGVGLRPPKIGQSRGYKRWQESLNTLFDVTVPLASDAQALARWRR